MLVQQPMLSLKLALISPVSNGNIPDHRLVRNPLDIFQWCLSRLPQTIAFAQCTMTKSARLNPGNIVRVSLFWSRLLFLVVSSHLIAHGKNRSLSYNLNAYMAFIRLVCVLSIPSHFEYYVGSISCVGYICHAMQKWFRCWNLSFGYSTRYKRFEWRNCYIEYHIIYYLFLIKQFPFFFIFVMEWIKWVIGLLYLFGLPKPRNPKWFNTNHNKNSVF